jgi:hypothetical protein
MSGAQALKRKRIYKMAMVNWSPEKAALSHDQVLDRLAAELARDRGGTTGRYVQATLYQWHGWRKLMAADDSRARSRKRGVIKSLVM